MTFFKINFYLFQFIKAYEVNNTRLKINRDLDIGFLELKMYLSRLLYCTKNFQRLHLNEK